MKTNHKPPPPPSPLNSLVDIDQVNIYLLLAGAVLCVVLLWQISLSYLMPIFGMSTAYFAAQKGRNHRKWFLYGVLIFIVALPHALKTYSKADPYKKILKLFWRDSWLLWAGLTGLLVVLCLTLGNFRFHGTLGYTIVPTTLGMTLLSWYQYKHT